MQAPHVTPLSTLGHSENGAQDADVWSCGSISGSGASADWAAAGSEGTSSGSKGASAGACAREAFASCSHVHKMSEVPSIFSSQRYSFFTPQLSAISSAAATHVCPKLSQNASHLFPAWLVSTSARQPPHWTPLSTPGHSVKGAHDAGPGASPSAGGSSSPASGGGGSGARPPPGEPSSSSVRSTVKDGWSLGRVFPTACLPMPQWPLDTNM
mmetsp:Transcript_41993/g.126839  ORF Transcript_41993/g.126839 Transcript_41993/m.126839 type:complete len:212 (-) Transcript_41993:697-1332(-)